MKTPERDKILKDIEEYIKGSGNIIAVLEERDKSILRELHSINEHQAEQNGYIKDTIEATNKNSINTAKNGTWIIAFRWIIGTGATVLSIVLTKLYGLW